MAFKPQHLASARVERLICLVRVGLASASLFAVWLDPVEPERYAALTYGLHIAFVAYAVAVAGLTWRRDPGGWWPFISHAIDIGAASIFQYLTLGPASPFFVYFVFAQFSAALRWGWRATIRTAAVVLVAYVVMGLWLSRTLGPAEFEMNRFIIRIAYLTVVGALLAVLGQHEERLREEIRRLARWPIAGGRDTSDVIAEIAEHSAGIVGARSATLVWSRNEEPWFYVLSWPALRGIERYPPGEMDPVVPPELADAPFACPRPRNGDGHILVGRERKMASWQGPLLNPVLGTRLTDGGFVCAPIRTDTASGYAIFSGLATARAELLPLAEVVGREIGTSLDHAYAFERARGLAISEDRLRLAQDLHDGVLQSLTGVRLELQHLSRASDGSNAERLARLERALAIEQRELRQFIESLKPSPAVPAGARLAARLDELGRRVALEWRASIAVHVKPPDLMLTGPLDRAVPLMVHEGMVNALKHAHPSTVSVVVAQDGETLRVTIADDGRGFPFQGHLDHDSLTRANVGPVSLRERVASLGGHLSVDSTSSGSRVELSMPLEPVGA